MMIRSIGWKSSAALLAGAVMLLQGTPGQAGEPACSTSSPSSGAYSVTICMVDPVSGATLAGDQPVNVTVSNTGGRTVEEVVFTLGGQYLLTDFESPISFTLPTDRFGDGSRSLSASALMSDGFKTQSVAVPVSFVNGQSSPPPNTNVFSPRGTEPPEGEPLVVGAVGDGAFGSTRARTVTNLVASWNPNMFLYLGDVYENATTTEFYNWYGTTQDWGQFRSITNPTIGNHEYNIPNASPYFDYWDNVPHYYSYDAGGWHFISLDSNTKFRNLQPGTGQYQWLQNDLATNTNPCRIAYFHHPRIKGSGANNDSLAAIWSLLANNGVDVALVGHEHSYQRWHPLNASGVRSDNGVTQIVVGTGGEEVVKFNKSQPRRAIGFDTSPNAVGAFRMKLHPDSLDYMYANSQGTSLDSGSIGCFGGAVPDTEDPQPPDALTATADGSSSVNLSWTPGSDNIGVTAYDIYRDNVLLTSVAAQTTSYKDTTVSPSTPYEYFVQSRDAAMNTSDPSNTATATTSAFLFEDDFESGNLSKWTQVGGMSVQAQQVFGGGFAARATSTGPGVYATKFLSSGQSDFYYRFRFKVLNKSAHAVYLNRLRTSTNSVVGGLFLNPKHRLAWRNGPGDLTTVSGLTVSQQVWHEALVHVKVAGASSRSEVWLDGNPVTALTRTDSLGSNPVARFQLGEVNSASGRTFDIAFDDVTLGTSPPGP